MASSSDRPTRCTNLAAYRRAETVAYRCGRDYYTTVAEMSQGFRWSSYSVARDPRFNDRRYNMCSTPGRRTATRYTTTKPLSADPGFSDMLRRSNISHEMRQREKRRKMLESQHPHVKAVRIDRVACPIHILKLKAHLRDIGLHETLKITAGTLSVLTDLTSACHALGHAVELVEDKHGPALYVTRAC